ncbi:hypothetical protein [Streptomyces sp. NBC_00572]|uniref:hypothetical protein n=1 Tax=Streptomyces sp. NBC_00572 TaxID=2903664 RepID=UPI002259742F|nr:hypothetical protein [Streptomyces sp. NBC_00572]MCX4985501.1 hypothetical protein [Streptomyces sp. NBC_00572]
MRMPSLAEVQNPLTVVQLLWCGQGMTALIEIYNDGVAKAEADFLGLVNCGGDSVDAQQALDYITAKVAARHLRLLNLVVLTRLDASHISLLGELGDRLQSIGARVMDVFSAGGRNDIPDSVRKFLASLRYQPQGVAFVSEGQSSYSRPGLLSWISEHNGTYFRILASNRDSFVLVVETYRFSVVMPGELTPGIMEDTRKLGSLKGLLPPVVALVLPQDTALATAVRNHLSSGSAAGDAEWELITWFAGEISPANIGVSAGPQNAFHHPIAQVIELFSANLQKEAPHTYVTYVLPTRGDSAKNFSGWIAKPTEYGIRSTVAELGGQATYLPIEYKFTLRPAPIEEA